MRDSHSLILFFDYDSPTREELEGIKEEADEIDESEYVILEDFKSEELGASVLIVPTKNDMEKERKI